MQSGVLHGGHVTGRRGGVCDDQQRVVDQQIEQQLRVDRTHLVFSNVQGWYKVCHSGSWSGGWCHAVNAQAQRHVTRLCLVQVHQRDGRLHSLL